MKLDPNTVAFLVAHAGHDTSAPVGPRLGIGALSGLLALAGLSAILLASKRLRDAYTASVGDLLVADPASISRSARIAAFLVVGIVLGLVFELVVLWIERVRPVMIIIGGRVTVTDLVAVGVVALLLALPTRGAVRRRPERFERRDTARVAAASVAYGILLLVMVSLLHVLVPVPT